MEHLYENRGLYGLEVLKDDNSQRNDGGPSSAAADSAGGDPNKFEFYADDKMFYVDHGYERGDQPPFTPLWSWRTLRRLLGFSLSFASNLLKEFLQDLKSDVFFLPSFLHNFHQKLKSFSLKQWSAWNLRSYRKELVWMYNKSLRPLLSACRQAFLDLDRPTKVFLILLSGVTAFCLLKSQVYVSYSWIRRKDDEASVKGKIVLITGANSGIGERLVYEFMERGATVIMLSSDVERTMTVANNVFHHMARKVGTPVHDFEKADEESCRMNLTRKATNLRSQDYFFPIPTRQPFEPEYMKRLQWIQVDLSSPVSIWRGVYHIFETFPRVDILINNAAMCYPSVEKIRTPSEDLEAHFSVNYLGHFILTNLILSFTKMPIEQPIKIINVLCHHALSEGKVTLPEIETAFQNNGEFQSSLKGSGPYAISKYLLYLFNEELTKRLEEKGLKKCVRTYAVSPQPCETNLFRYTKQKDWDHWALKLPADAGAQTILYCSLSSSCSCQSGLYYSQCRPSSPSMLFGSALPGFSKLCSRLWDLSCQLTNKSIAPLKTEDFHFKKADFFGGAIFSDDEDDTKVEENWRPELKRELLEFRNYQPPMFKDPLVMEKWKEEVCGKGLVDIYEAINGPLHFAMPKQEREKKEAQALSQKFDPIFHHSPTPLKTNGVWIL